MTEPPRPLWKNWWDYQIRTYESRYQEFCRTWHLDPEDPASASEFEEENDLPDREEFR